MASEPLTFPLRILSLKGLVFDKPVESVYITGTDGEFELLAYHFPLMAALKESEIRIADHDPVLIRVGIVMFKDNECTIIVEVDPNNKVMQRSWDEGDE